MVSVSLKKLQQVCNLTQLVLTVGFVRVSCQRFHDEKCVIGNTPIELFDRDGSEDVEKLQMKNTEP
jgi:hypothetical protein